MPDILLPALVAAVVSMLFGSASAAVISHTLSSYRADREYRLKKLEELFTAVQTWVHLQRIYFFRLSDIATGETTANEGIELANNAGEQAQRQFYSAFMIAKVYFQNLTRSVDRIRELEKKGADVAAKFIQEHTEGQKYPDYDDAFNQSRSELLRGRDEFNQEFFVEADELKRGGLSDWFRRKFGDC